MRGASRRTSESLLVSPADSFAWGASTIAALRHCSLPWYDAAGPPIAITGSPLPGLSDVGPRDALSLVAQFAAHQAFLQFAGIADGEVNGDEWVVVRKRGVDCRLIRIAARATDPAEGPPVLSLIHEFASIVGAELAVLRQSWARAETAYAEADEILRRDASADLRWMRRSASGEVLSPGPEVLREIWTGQTGNGTWFDQGAIESLTRMAALDRSVTVVRCASEFALHRYGALTAIDPAIDGSDEEVAVVAERIAERVASGRHVILVGPKVDHASQRAIEIAASLGTATWLFHDAESETLRTRWFVLSRRLAARGAVDAHLARLPDPRPWIEAFVASADYRAYLQTGDLLVTDGFETLPEPRRSYLAAIALLGTHIPAEAASKFLKEFLFDQPLESLCVEGVSKVVDGVFTFASEAVRAHCATHIPPTSRAALCRAAALTAEPERAAFLLIDAGDTAAGVARLEAMRWRSSEEIVDRLSRVPQASLSVALRRALGHALVECGRYRDAAVIASELDTNEQEFLLARCDRRSGDYDTALMRLERLTCVSFDALLLRCEILRVGCRFDEAAQALQLARAGDAEERIRVAYEASLLALETGTDSDAGWTSQEHYLAARFLTYRALADGDFDSAEHLAAEALRVARSPIERVDAWLDLLFGTFSAGRWTQTRRVALEALAAIEETQGDRAAAGILFTLTYLAADEGQWSAASAMLERLRHYYAAVHDTGRLFELKLLEAHLHFSAARFSEARRVALQVLDRERLLPQVREAAALIVDEVNSIERRREPLRSTGGSGNRELTDRHLIIAARRGENSLAPALPFNAEQAAWESRRLAGPGPKPSARSESLKLMRAALTAGAGEIAETFAADAGVDLSKAESGGAGELDLLRAAATAEWPFADEIFGGRRWMFASRNRLGHWTTAGPVEASQIELDRIAGNGVPHWLACSDRELLFVESSDDWPAAMRDALAAIVRNRAENERLRRLASQDEAPAAPAAGVHGMIGESPAIRQIFEAVSRVARRDVAVCVCGESGTGKELVARAIHRDSTRRTKPFVAVNCAALPENLIESELFGHVRGAFTGADRDRAGLIESSDGGTLFLDEIGEMPLMAQAKLLRFLQDGEFRRVGDTANRTSDVRIISATNRRLEAAVEEGRFREDLYYRIRGVEISIPPLRERGNDLLLLARHFLGQERAKHKGGPAGFASEVESLFRAYRWPGNVRELQNAVRAGHAMAGDAREISVEHLPERIRAVSPARVTAGSYQDAVSRFRRDLIEKSLLEAGGNQNRAAALLNISRQALAYQIRELGILVQKRPARSM